MTVELELENQQNFDELSVDTDGEEEKPPEGEPSTPEGEEEDEALKKEKEVPKSVQRRLNKLTKYRRTAERERDELKAKNTILEQKLKEFESNISSAQTVSLPDPKPKEDDFDSTGDYVNALFEWHEKNRKPEDGGNAEIEKDIKEIKEGLKVQAETTKKGEFNKIYRDGIKKFGNEFEDVRDLSITDSVYESIMNHKNPEDILFYLINHPEDYSELSDLSPVSAIEKIAEIKQQIKNNPKTIITTSQPTIKLGGGSTKGKNLLNSEKMSVQEFSKLYEKQYGEE